MDEKALQKRLTEIFERLGYETEARELRQAAALAVEKDGVKLEVQASTPNGRRSTRRRRRR